jgi:hypothetical protein
MAMAFYEPTKWAMVVMDGKRAVAKARHRPMGMWLLEMLGGSWIDPRARTPLRDDFPADFKDLYSQYPNLLVVKSKAEARRILTGLCDGKPYKLDREPKAQPVATTRQKKTARETRAV